MRIELLLLLSFLAMIIAMIACSVPRRSTLRLSPTLFPALTLTTYNPQIVTRVGADAAIAATIAPPGAQLSDIDISPPRCYQSGSPQVTCLGFLRNRAREAFSNITLKARFTGAEAVSQRQTTFSLEQRRVAAETAAPYRLQLPGSRLENAALEIEVVSAEPSAPAGLELTLRNARGEYLDELNRYHFSATVKNDSGQPAKDIRLIVTLTNAEGELVGFRAADTPDSLPIGEEVDVDLAITPLETSTAFSHHITLEALPLNALP